MINGFIFVCELLDVTPSLRLWRNLFTLVLGSADLHGPLSVSGRLQGCVRCPFEPKRVQANVLSYLHKWWLGIPILPPDDGPRFRLNQTVPEMSREEAVVGIYLSMIPRIASGHLAYVPSNWLPIRHEMFLAAVGLSQSCNKGNFLCWMCEFIH